LDRCGCLPHLLGTAERARIADALDELFSDLDAGVAALQRVREKLKLYRASVLKAAVEGALTAEWRKHHPQAELASVLKLILAERRRRWEDEQLRKFKERGPEPPKNWKAKYRNQSPPTLPICCHCRRGGVGLGLAKCSQSMSAPRQGAIA
jgi:hypothetical protein